MAPAPTHDLLVIGAGPSGATAARVAAMRGLRVALIDKAPFPRDKLCGGAVTGRAMSAIRGIYGDLPPPLFHPCHEVRLKAGARVLGVEGGAPVIHMTMRRAFDAALHSAAIAAGASDFSGQRIASLDPDGGEIRLAGGTVLRAQVILGADGVNSAVARALFGRAHDPAQVAFALEVELPGPTSDHLELDLLALRWGYGWDFPKTHGRTLGVGGLAARNPDMAAQFRHWLLARGTDPAAARIKGHHLPMGEVRRVPGKGRVLLSGDAAGLVDPITGEGIGWAVHSGRIAAEAVAATLTSGAPERALALYCQSAAPMLRELRRARLLARLVYHPLIQPRFHAALGSSARLRRRYLDLLSGDLDYADLGLLRLSRLGLRLLFGRGGAASG